MNPDLETLISRRSFLGKATSGIGALALSSLLTPDAHAQNAKNALQGVAYPLPYKPRVKRVIQLYMAGGPSHLETFDFKPKLREMHGQGMPESFTKGQQIAQLANSKLLCYGAQVDFERYGKSGQMMAKIFPKLG